MREVSVLGVVYRVVDGAEIDGDAEGECAHVAGEIRISKDVAPARRWSVLRHEIGHAVAFESGFRDRLREQFRLSHEEAIRLEEAIVGHFVPAYVDTIEHTDRSPGGDA